VPTLSQIGLVAGGSALGGLTRWVVTDAFAHWFGKDFPWGTLFINISGSLFLGWFFTTVSERLSESSWVRPDDLKLLVAVGFTGAYTTFSTFELDTHILLRDKHGLIATAYLAGSVFLGLLAVRIGVILAKPR
jgi:CrcB protein